MPPERRMFASPPRSPEIVPISLFSSSSSSTTSAPTAQDTLPIPTYISDASCMSMSTSSMGGKVQQHQQQQRRTAAKRQNSSQTHEAQPRHQHLTRKQHRRLQDAHEEYHRQRELFQAQQQQQRQQQQQQQQQQQEQQNHRQRQRTVDQASYQEDQQYIYSPQSSQTLSQSQSSESTSSSSVQRTPYAAPFAPSQRFANNRSDLSRSSSSSSLYHPSVLDKDTTETTMRPRSRRSSPGLSDHHHHHHHPPRRRGPYSAWTAMREKERTRLLTNLSTLRESLQTVPLSSQIARENLGRLHQRIQHRRARARETILYDLHQGVKVVEAQVHRQVEMVLSRLKEAPASKYAFALTNSFLSQVIPHTGSVTGSLLAQAANGLFQTDLSSSIFAQQHQQQQQEARNGSEADTLTNDFDSIALAGQVGTDRPSTLGGLGDPNEPLTRGPPGVAAACSQILSAALPSFIPSMVAPLVCVFSYQTPAISELAPIPYTPFPRPDASSAPSSSSAGGSSSSSSGIKKVEEPARKEFVYPWGHPNEPYPPPPLPTAPTTSQPPQPTTTTPTITTATPATSPSSSQSLSSSPTSPTTTSNPEKYPSPQRPSITPAGPHPDSGIVVVHSKTWTQHEREALYLAATRFRLSGQWPKIREMMNLHRTDQEIESEYKKLYAHRELDDHSLLSDDEDEHYEARPSIIDAMTHNSEGEENGDADDETETMIFMKFGGSRSAHHKQQQLQHLQSRRLHYDLLHLQPHPPVPQQELQHHHQPQQQNDRQQQPYQGHGAFNVPPLHDNNTHYQQQQQQQRQRLSSDPDPIRIFKKEFMIDKRFTLEEIPMRI